MNYIKSIKCQKKFIRRLVNKYKTKEIVDTVHLGGRRKKSTPDTDRKIIRFVKTNPFTRASDTIRELELDVSELTTR